MPYWVWLICGTVMLVIEILATNFVILWFGLAALVAGIVAYWVQSISIQLTVFAVSSVIFFSVGWFWLRKNMKMNLRPVATEDSIFGEAGTVISANAGNPPGGKVRFQAPLRGDDVWEYISDDSLSMGDRCEVIAMEGTKVRVRKVSH
jgi:membrane protein implicated in regulation of membrane protease activity